jgi:hypothetical protein
VASFEAIEKIASPRYLLEFLATIRENLPTRLHEEPESFDIKTRRLKELLEKSAPKVFTAPPAKLSISFEHIANDRGERFNIDAWTGKLWSEPTGIPVSRLAGAWY